MRITLDSNILIYAADSQGGSRHVDAVGLLRRAVRADCILTLQSLGEFFQRRRGKASYRPLARKPSSMIGAVLPVHAADSDALTEDTASPPSEKFR